MCGEKYAEILTQKGVEHEMKTVSILLYFDTEDACKIQRCTDSIFRTSGLTAEELQVILLNPFERENTNGGEKPLSVNSQETEKSWSWKLQELQEQYPGSVLSVPVPRMEAPQAYNRGMELASGEYLSFMLASSFYTSNALRELLYISETERREEDLMSLRPIFAGEGEGKGLYPMAPFGGAADVRGETGIVLNAAKPADKTDIVLNAAKPAGKTGGMSGASADGFCVQLVLQAYVIKRSLIGSLRFREELHEEAFIELLLQLLIKKEGSFFYYSGAQYEYTVPLENDEKNCDLAEKKWWYLDSARNFLLDFTKKMKKKYSQGIPGYLQRIIFYLICVKFKCNLQGEDRQMMRQEETASFFQVCGEIFAELDTDLLYQCGPQPDVPLPRALRMVFLCMKAEQLGCEIKLSEHNNKVICRMEKRSLSMASEMERMYDPAVEPAGMHVTDTASENVEMQKRISGTDIQEICVGDLSEESLDVRVINYREGRLGFDGFFTGADFLEEGSFELFGMIEGDAEGRAGDCAKGRAGNCMESCAGTRVEMKPSPVYGLLKCFGTVYARKYGVHVEVPVAELSGQGRKLAFYLKYGESLNRLKLVFSTMSSRLLTYSQKAYWRFDHDRYMLTRTGAYLNVSKSNALRTMKQELLFDAALLAQRNRRKEAFESVLLRLLYWLTRPVMKKKRIWITFDKLYKAGDNGEYMFQYCREHQSETDCYYVINEDAPDCRRLKRQHPGRILYANTWKTRLMALHAEVILATHAGATTYLGFPGKLHKYYKDLYQADNVCIQHGLSIQQIASFQNRLYANTKLYCCASPYEMKNISDPLYGYEPDMLKMTGLARYDGLKNAEQKQILITPTWRKNAVHTKGVGMTNSHNVHFKETAYYRIYNSLINDQRLITCARDTGYRIIFLLHPAMSAQMEDYDRNDFVELMQATGDMSYEKILTESSLMVTDYSGVQFDFAYQRKPLIYYHPEELPPHYTEGGLIYETMGFGPICTGHEQIVETLCQYMKDGCRMQPEYQKRADQFFAFDDFNNAERIFREVMEFEEKKREVNS